MRPKKAKKSTTPPGVSGTQSLRIPITNIYDGSDYSAQLLVGSQQTPVNVILDTGSSTLAVTPAAYNAAKDKNLQPSTYAQLVEYGTGGWAGPVVNTSLSFGVAGSNVALKNAPVAICEVQEQGNFEGGIQGILGLAYNGLNEAFDLQVYLAKKNPKSPNTYPWPFPTGDFNSFASMFQQLIKSQRVPQLAIVPYFTELEQQGVTADKFAFYTLRSWVNYATTVQSKIASDPLNNGYFILGGGEEQTDLYTGDFVEVDVVDDLYYNTNLLSVQVEGCPAVKALPLQAQYSMMASNSIVDSGTSDLSLSGDVYNAIMASLKKLNPNFITMIKAGTLTEASQKGIAASKLNLSKWPDIYFNLAGVNGEPVTLTVSPQTYWQVNFPAPGRAAFQISGPVDGEDINQSILGLPLMNNYYTVFDRSLDTYGVIRFAAIKQPS